MNNGTFPSPSSQSPLSPCFVLNVIERRKEYPSPFPRQNCAVPARISPTSFFSLSKLPHSPFRLRRTHNRRLFSPSRLDEWDGPWPIVSSARTPPLKIRKERKSRSTLFFSPSFLQHALLDARILISLDHFSSFPVARDLFLFPLRDDPHCTNIPD